GHSKASIFHGADEYLEVLKRKYEAELRSENDHEIAALKNALPGEGDAVGAAPSNDKMLSVQKNNENRSPKTNALPHFEEAGSQAAESGIPLHQDHSRSCSDMAVF
ncbi:unnamed protein product, partial [Symbiodinium pilosum]